MKKTTIVVAMLILVSCDTKSKIDPYSFKAPYEIQKHFSHEVKWDAAKQERWMNGELWVDSTKNFKCIVIHHSDVQTPDHASEVTIKP
jgi:hypothetical protein